MMRSTLPLLLLALSSALAAPVAPDDELPEVLFPGQQKRAALVLDRLLVALQNALHEGDAGASAAHGYERASERDGPRAAPLIANDMVISGVHRVARTGLQRRGQPGRGRVLRCYFNAITCF